MNNHDEYKPQSKPAPGNLLLDDFIPARFLSVADLRDRWNVDEMVITISRISIEDTIPNPRDLDPTTKDRTHPKGKPRVVQNACLHFNLKSGKEFFKGYLMKNKADQQALKSATEAKTAGELIGKRILIMITTHRSKEVLRISALPPLPAEMQPEPLATTATPSDAGPTTAGNTATNSDGLTDQQRSAYTQEFDEYTDADTGL